jgi:hypothetical protein
MRRALAVLAVLVATSESACSVSLTKELPGEISRNSCNADSDCADGECWSGACVAHLGTLSTVLLEVTPPTTSVGGLGGVRFLEIATNLQGSGEDLRVDLAAPATVHGFVFAYTASSACPANGQATVPVAVTLTPREQSYGLSTKSYTAQTELVSLPSNHPCAQKLKGATQFNEFVVTVPPAGNYDVYVTPAAAAPTDAGVPETPCGFVPQLFRNIPVGSGDVCLALPSQAPEDLSLVVQLPVGASSPASLEGWTVDVVHPITGHLISERQRLGAPGSIGTGTGLGYTRHLRISPIVGETAIKPEDELVRFSPPAGTDAPVIQLQRSGLEANAPARTAITPPLGSFPGSVALKSWVWRADSIGVGVPSTVTLTAKELEGIDQGIFASFSTTVQVGDDGRLGADVLPGTYRVRTVPVVEQGLAAAETTLAVACSRDPVTNRCAPNDPSKPPQPEEGKTVLVPAAATITGTVFAPFGHKRIDGATVQALPASVEERACASGDAGDAGACLREPLGILDLSLGEDAFVPRAASAIANHGRFTMTEVDCGGCTPESGALFDLTVRPPDGSRLPWLVKPAVTVGAPVDFPELDVPLPILHRGKIEVPQGPSEPAVPVPGALIRAYILRDNLGGYISDPTGLPTCSAGASASSTRCIRSVLQVAETRAGDDATFELVLPASID